MSVARTVINKNVENGHVKSKEDIDSQLMLRYICRVKRFTTLKFITTISDHILALYKTMRVNGSPLGSRGTELTC